MFNSYTLKAKVKNQITQVEAYIVKMFDATKPKLLKTNVYIANVGYSKCYYNWKTALNKIQQTKIVSEIKKNQQALSIKKIT